MLNNSVPSPDDNRMFHNFSAGQQTVARPAVRTLLQNDDPDDHKPRSLSFAHGRIRPAPNSPARAMQVRFTSHLPSTWLEVLSYHITARRSSDLAKQQGLMQNLEMPEQVHIFDLSLRDITE